MPRLASRHFARLLAFLSDCYVVRDLDGFAQHVVTAIPRLIPADITTYNEVDVPHRALLVRWNPEVPRSPEWDRAFRQHMHEHPVIAHQARTRDGRTHKISDFLSRTQFHDLGLYTEAYRRLDVEYQMAVILPARAPLVIGIALNRALSDFSERERLMLDLVRPHPLQGHRNAAVFTTAQGALRLAWHAVDACSGGGAMVSRAGEVLYASPDARRRFAEYFPGDRKSGRRLPDALDRWMTHHHAAKPEPALPVPRAPLVVERQGRRLVAHHLCDVHECLLLLREQATAFDGASLKFLGLSRREEQVLAWLAQGKTNPEIAVILDSRPKTVSKHLERIYRKLGVENRTAAVAALQAAASRS